jgi:MFS family permease
MASCVLTTVFQTLEGVMPFITIMLFFGAAVVPSSTGIVIDAVEPEERAFSSAMSQMGCNILGYALAPFLSGFVAEMAGGPEGLKWGFRLVCWWGAFSFIFMLLAVHNSTKRLKSAEGDVKKDDREEVDVEVEEEDESGPSAVSPRGRKAPVTGLSLMTGPVSGKTLAHHRNSSE